MANVAKEAGNKLYAEGSFEQALENYNRAVELEPGGNVHYSNRSACYFSMGRLPEALQDAETCIRLKADWPRGYLRKGKALHELKRYDEAITALKSGLQLDPSSELLQSALKASESKQKPPLSDLFSPAKVARLRTHPKTAAYFDQPDFQQIVDKVQRNPNDTAGLLLDPRVMACFQVNMELELESIKTNAFVGLSDILKNNPIGGLGGNIPMPNFAMPEFKMPNRGAGGNVPMPEFTMPNRGAGGNVPMPDFKMPNLGGGGVGKMPNRPGQMPNQEVRKEPEAPPKAPSRDTKKAEEAKQAGNEAYRARRFPEALRLYDQAIALNPCEIVYYTNKAAVLIETGANEDCVVACEEGVRKGREAGAEEAKIVKALVRKGTAQRRLNRNKAALESLLEAQRLHDDPSVSQQIQELRTLLSAETPPPPPYSEPTSMSSKAEKCNGEGSAAFKRGHYAEAEQMYSEAIDLQPGEAKYWSNRSAARIREGNFPGALRDINKSIDLNTGVVKTWNRKGHILQQTKDIAGALNAYEKALEISPEDAEATEEFGACVRALYAAGEGWSAELQEEGVRAVLEERGQADSQEIRRKLKQLLRLG